MKRKLTALLLAALMVCGSLAGCGSKITPEAEGSEGGDAPAAESTYPEKNITALVYWAAGGTTDTCVRSAINAIPDDMLSKNIIVSNVAGGSGLVGATQFVKSAADGYTIGVLNCDLVLNHALGNTDISSDQFIPLACIEQDPYLFLVPSDAPYDTFEEFVDYVKANPGTLSVGDTGSGAVPHLVYTVLNKQLGLDLKTVAYDSSADSVIATVSGECDSTITAPGAAAGQLEAGTLKAIACSGAERLAAYPDVPCMSESYEELKDMNILSWIMVVALKDTPADAVSYLQEIFTAAATSDEYRETLESLSFQAVPAMDNDEMLQFVADQAKGKTDQDGKLTVPEIEERERHGAYILGYTDGTFGPSRSMTRAEAAAIFARLLAEKNGDTISTVANTRFTDIPAHAWYSGYAKYLNNNGVTYGKSKTIFAPNDAITRAEFTTLAVRFFDVYGDGDAEIMEQYKDFNDVSDGYWAATYIKAAAKHGWINGYGDGSFRADDEINRAEVVTIVNRLLGREADEAYIADNLRKLNTFPDVSRKHWAYYAVMEAANAHTAILGDNESWSK